MITRDNTDLDIQFFPWQLEFFFNIVFNIQLFSKPKKHHRFKVLPKGRRLGATRGAALFCLVMLLQGKNILWVDTVQGNLNSYFGLYFKPVLQKVKKKLWKYSTSEKKLTYRDSRIDFRSVQKPENIEGFAYDIIIVNEAGIVLKGSKGRALWQQTLLAMTIDYKADVYFIGTPKGRKAKKDELGQSEDGCCLYAEMIEKGRNNSPEFDDWATYQYSSYDNPALNKDDIKKLEKEFHPLVARQEIFGDLINLNGNPIFKREWIEIVNNLPPRSEWERVIISTDTAFKIGSENDNSAIVTILEAKNGYYIIDVLCKKMEFPELSKEAQKKYYQIERIFGNKLKYFLIEDAASGQSLYQVLKNGTRMKLKKTVPKGDKYSRSVGTTVLYESGNVKVLRGPWNKKYLDEITSFNETMDTPDDQVDATTHGLLYYMNNKRGWAA